VSNRHHPCLSCSKRHRPDRGCGISHEDPFQRTGPEGNAVGQSRPPDPVQGNRLHSIAIPVVDPRFLGEILTRIEGKLDDLSRLLAPNPHQPLG